MTEDAQDFVDKVLRGCIETIEKHTLISPSIDDLASSSFSDDKVKIRESKPEELKENKPASTTPLPVSPLETGTTESTNETSQISGNDEVVDANVVMSGGENDGSEGSTSLYIVVERVSRPSGDSDTSHESLHHAQESIAEQVVRLAAVQLRDLCEGITVFCANHERAAPGLEACMNAVSVGAADRRRHPGGHGRSTKALHNSSYMGFVALSSEDLLGLQSQQDTDAAQGVLQSCWCAEWNGRGNLNSFAKRAHAQWRSDRGLPPLALVGQRKAPVPRRRGRRQLFDEQALDHAMRGFLYDFGVVALAVAYIIFHYGKEIYDLLAEWFDWCDELFHGH